MESVISAIKNTVSISLFNKGLAGKIFEEVKRDGPKVVMKNNTAECVILSPEEYIKLVDEVNDAKLISLAVSRLKKYNPDELIPFEEITKEYGISLETLKVADEVEFE